ncbi:unnamed protein product [Amoebophrya sp. A120]|nr:unnamed protein product [Amoebophrya sp. A120]|eukprot:GSA120T00016679001.1
MVLSRFLISGPGGSGVPDHLYGEDTTSCDDGGSSATSLFSSFFSSPTTPSISHKRATSVRHATRQCPSSSSSSSSFPAPPLAGRITTTRQRPQRLSTTSFVLSEAMDFFKGFDPMSLLKPQNFSVSPPSVMEDGFGPDVMAALPAPLQQAGQALQKQLPMKDAAGGAKNLAPLVGFTLAAGATGGASASTVGMVAGESLGVDMGSAITNGIHGGADSLSGLAGAGSGMLTDTSNFLDQIKNLKSIFDPTGPRFDHHILKPAELSKLENVRPFIYQPWKLMLGTKPAMTYDLSITQFFKLVGSCIKTAQAVIKKIGELLALVPKLIAMVKATFKILKVFLDNLPNPFQLLEMLFKAFSEIWDFFMWFLSELTPAAATLMMQLIKAAVGLLRITEVDKYPMDIFIPAQKDPITAEDRDWIFMRKKYPINGRVMGVIGAEKYDPLDDPRPAKLILDRADMDLEKARRAYARAEEYTQRADLFAKQAREAANAVLKLQKESLDIFGKPLAGSEQQGASPESSSALGVAFL